MSEDLVERELKSPGSIASDGLNVFMQQLGPYAMAGIGLTGGSLVVVFGTIFVSLFVMFGAIFGGVSLAVALEMEWLASVCTLVGYVGVIVVALGLGSLLGPLNASLYRAVHAHMKGEKELSIGSAFSTVTHRMVGAVMLQAAMIFMALFLAMFCYLPALLVPFLFGLAMPIFAIEDEGVGGALGKSFNHVKDNVGWHAPFFGIGFVISLIAGNIPVLGPMFYAYYLVDGYNVAFGDGSVTDKA